VNSLELDPGIFKTLRLHGRGRRLQPRLSNSEITNRLRALGITGEPLKREEVIASGDVTDSQLIELYISEHGQCFYCGVLVPANLSASNPAGFDHFIPICHGGLHTISNLRVCCSPCNSVKGTKDPSMLPRRMLARTRWSRIASRDIVTPKELRRAARRAVRPTPQ
jgi:5-methylcytosine-specific restriction endonuclease McrA